MSTNKTSTKPKTAKASTPTPKRVLAYRGAALPERFRATLRATAEAVVDAVDYISLYTKRDSFDRELRFHLDLLGMYGAYLRASLTANVSDSNDEAEIYAKYRAAVDTYKASPEKYERFRPCSITLEDEKKYLKTAGAALFDPAVEAWDDGKGPYVPLNYAEHVWTNVLQQKEIPEKYLKPVADARKKAKAAEKEEKAAAKRFVKAAKQKRSAAPKTSKVRK